MGEQNLHCFKITLDDGVMKGRPVVYAPLSHIGAVSSSSFNTPFLSARSNDKAAISDGNPA